MHAYTYSIGFNVLDPFIVRRQLIAGKAHELHLLLSEFVGVLGHLCKFRCAYRREISCIDPTGTIVSLVKDKI